MSDRDFIQPPPSLQQQTQRAWQIARLHREGALDRLAALQSLDAIYTPATSRPLRRLCETIAYRMFPEVERPQPDVEPIVEVYAR
jgi:hypothetical protein